MLLKTITCSLDLKYLMQYFTTEVILNEVLHPLRTFRDIYGIPHESKAPCVSSCCMGISLHNKKLESQSDWAL